MPKQSFVKFFGASDTRLPQSHSIIEEIKRAGCHWACTYSVNRRPRQVMDGDLIFMARLVSEPNDHRIFGRAIAMEHRPGRDDASPEDIIARPWKKQWPCYIRVHNAEFVDGTMRNGVSLKDLMDALSAETWASTSRRAAQTGQKNIDPHRSVAQQTQLELTPRASQWLSDQLEHCFQIHGKIGCDKLDKLDWPKLSKQR